MPSRGRRARLGRVIECQAMGGSEGEGGCLRTNQIGLDPPLKDCLFTGDGFSLLLSYELFPLLPLLSFRTIIFSPFSIVSLCPLYPSSYPPFFSLPKMACV